MDNNQDENSPDHDANVEECGMEIRCWCFKSRRRRIPYLSKLNTSTWALLFLSTVAFLEGMIVNGLYNVSVSTIEKRFGLQSFESGLITSTLDIAGSVATLVTSYVGGAGHKPLWIGCGILIMGLGSLIFSFPHFLAPTYSPSTDVIADCAELSVCSHTSLRYLRSYFFLGFILVGIGATPLYTLAISYLDENVDRAQSPMYSGVFFASALLGPGVGFIAGGAMLQIFTSNEVPPLGINENSPAWIGNWWLSFVIVGCCLIVLSIPVFLYPRQLPETDIHRKNRETEVQHTSETIRAKSDQNFGMRIKDAPKSAWILMKNPTVMLISFATAVDSGLLIGLATFGPKYIESLYGLSAADAGFYFGALAIVCASTGHVISGAIITKWKLSVLQMLKMCIAVSAISVGCYFILALTCENPKIVGGFVPYPGENVTCQESSCGCTTAHYNPICGMNNLTYLSPCDAGCMGTIGNTHENCSRTGEITNGSWPSAVNGRCASDYISCPNLALYLFILGVAVFFTFFNAQPALQCSMRVVLFQQRSFCLGFQWIITRVLGSIPVPIIFGKVLDLSCQVWRKECQDCTSCFVYDNIWMSYYFTFLCVALKAASMTFIALATWAFKLPPPENSQEINGDTEETDTRL